MPFNWNIDRLKKANIFVHEEISVPKSNAFTNASSYTGTVNGLDVTKDIVLDNTDPKTDIIHIMLTKDTLLKLADGLIIIILILIVVLPDIGDNLAYQHGLHLCCKEVYPNRNQK